MSRISSFEEFWPYYLNEHKSSLNRNLHFMGTAGALAALTTAAITLNPLFLAAAPFMGYGPAWVGHFIVERNRPATFTYPLWSLRADFKMFGLMLTGRLGPHLERAAAQ